MALPITYSESTERNNFDGTGSTYRYVFRGKQLRPYDLPSAYVIRRGYTVAAGYSPPFTDDFGQMANASASKGVNGWGPDTGSTFGSIVTSSENFVYEKFRDAVKGASAMAAVNIAEFNQSLGMIENRAKQLLQFCNALRRGNLAKAASVLGIEKPKVRHQHSKSFANLFLEFHFGWEPMIADIGASVDILQGSIPNKYIRTRGKSVTTRYYSRVDTGQRINLIDVQATAQASASCRVEVVNPGLHMADQMGFVNPLGIAWELVPFSFVVDWFVPVSSFLNSMTDFLGLNLDRASYFTVLRTPVWLNDIQYYIEPYGHRHIVTTGFIARRILGIPSVTLVPVRAYGISPTRAATAISLLIQQGLRG